MSDEKYPIVCTRHDTGIVYHELGEWCPLCVAQNKIAGLISDYDELVAENDTLKSKIAETTSGAAGTI